MRRRSFVFMIFEAALAGAASLVPAAASAQMTGMHMAAVGDTAALLPATQALLGQVRAATARYRDLEAAKADGYRRFGRDEGPLMGQHWYRPDLVKRPLDLLHPSTLQYATIGGKPVLVGVAYTVYQRPGDPLPAGFPGDADHWHVHDVAKLAAALTDGRPLLHWVVERRIAAGKLGGGGGRTWLVMLHAWVWGGTPDGVFALEDRALPYLRLGLPAAFAASGPAAAAAAQGVALAAANGCPVELRRENALAHLTGEQQATLGRACDEAAARVRPLAAGRDADRLNAGAAAAWRAYAGTVDRVLTPEQKARQAAVMEHLPE